MKFSRKLVYNKLVANLFIYLLSKFHNIWLSSLEVIAFASSCCEVPVLWIFQSRPENLSVLTYFCWEFFCDA